VTLLVIDNSCLSHFARAGRLDLLKRITDGYDRSTTEEVMVEVLDGIADHPALGQLIGVQWFSIVELDLGETVRAAQIKAELGGDLTRDLGECAVLAVAEARRGIAVLDDRDAATVGRRRGVLVVGTLAVIAAALKRGVIERTVAEALVDDLAATDMRLPVDGSGFVPWCYANGLLP
jgi:predicted nucleic acid-binding protein